MGRLLIRPKAPKVDVLTIEIEHVDVGALERVQKDLSVSVHPSPDAIRIIQNKLRQKEHLVQHGCAVAEFLVVESNVESVQGAAKTTGTSSDAQEQDFGV
jgi:phosphoribosylaminoimidazole carboxylase